METSWKSNHLTTSYKPGSTSTYSSRDDISSARFGSVASPSTYRPSFSGGTYRIKRDPTASTGTPYVSRYASASTSKDDKVGESSAAKHGATSKYGGASASIPSKDSGQIKRYTSASNNVPKYGRSREPSPAALECTNRIKSREPSPSARPLRGKSQDPTPVMDSKCHTGYVGVNSYRMSSAPRAAASRYSSRYSSTASGSRAPSALPDKSISYLSVSDFRARSINRAVDVSSRKSTESELEEPAIAVTPEGTPAKDASESDPKTSESESSAEETFVSVSVVTRATSPTPPGATTVQRTRRIDIAKTIEKTMQRSTKKRETTEKEIQSDRLDDPTRYSRFGLSSRVLSYSPHHEARYTSSISQRFTVSPLATTSKSTSGSSDAKKEDTSKRGTSNSSEARTPKSKLSPPKAGHAAAGQASVESLSATNAIKSLPPTVPKADSPTKSSSSGSTSPVKWPNKDFRKSALNVGPTDQPRKSRTPSTGTESDGAVATTLNGAAPLRQRQERSPSASSEVSNASTCNNKRSGESKIRPRCHPKPGTTTVALSRQNGGMSLKTNAHKSCHPTTHVSTSTSACSSSGAESSGESSKPGKPKKSNGRRKLSDNNKVVNNSGESKQAPNVAATQAADTKKMSPNCATSNENSRHLQSTTCFEELRTPPENVNNSRQLNRKVTGDQSVHADSSLAKASENNAPMVQPVKAADEMQKLSTASPLFAARRNAVNSEPIFLESSESSIELGTQAIGDNSLRVDFETNTSPANNANENTTISNTTNTVPTIKISKNTARAETLPQSVTHLNSSHPEEFGNHFETDPSCKTFFDSNTNNPSTEESQSSNLSSDKTASTLLRTPNAELCSENSENIFSKNTEQQQSCRWPESSPRVIATPAFDCNHTHDMRYRLRHNDSGEVAWWLRNDADDTLNGGGDDSKTLNQENGHSSRCANGEQSTSVAQNGDGGPENTKDDLNTDENYCWSNGINDDNLSTPNGRDIQSSVTKSEIDEVDRKRESGGLECQRGLKTNTGIQLKICRVESGERAWWLDDDNESSNMSVGASVELAPQDENVPNAIDSNLSACAKRFFNVRRVDSGEKAWWQQDHETDFPAAVSPVVQAKKVQRNDSGERAWWLQDDEGETAEQEDVPDNSNASLPFNVQGAERNDDIEVQEIINANAMNTNHKNSTNSTNFTNSNSHLNDSLNYEYVERPPPLGHRASPDGLEDPIRHRNLPYDNIPTSQAHTKLSNTHGQRQHFISRHKNIDDFLGGLCRPRSLYFDCNSLSPARDDPNLLPEEITPDQVHIHDSTAQIAHIQRMRSESDYSPIRAATKKENLDDAAIQVYKDGDYGAYLDLESSLAEQAEEIEGLISSRKNSLVVRTQLSVRVHAIIDKLLSAEGSDLRRALFSLKQVFQEDKDLVHAFVALGGLNCLVRVGNGADQNYQNYILRALGQVMLYVDGMNGVMKHEPTMQWLYSLIASTYRSVVKTALKLLLVFVEYVETNCYLLVNAIHVVDKAQGTLPWSNIMRLLKDYDNADAELVIYATSLINKILAGLTDQDSFYDESDLLEQQGMESVINRYMAKPGTDMDLIDQLQLYEAVLKFEDGEVEGIRLPNNSMRKTQRCRQNGNDTVERRKSRRHSTGASPAATVINKVISSPKRNTPMYGVLDEDSSGSANSNEFSSEVFQGQKTNHGANDATPSLRRRRERAERHKSFLKEQQEAIANGFFTAFDKREGLEIGSENEDKKLLLQLQRDHTVKDLTQKLSNLPSSPTHAEILQNRIVGDMSGLISKAKEGLAKSKSKGEISRSSSVDQEIKKPEPKKSENELHWEELVRSMVRPLNLCDLDFTDLNSEDEKDILAPRGLCGGIPPPPPPIGIPPPMLPTQNPCPPPMNHMSNMLFSCNGPTTPSLTNSFNNSINGDVGNTTTIKKNKKTVKLFWKEVREDMIPVAVGKTIWDELPAANVDTQKLEHLFESRAKDLMTKEKQQELNKSKEVIVLDHKRSNAINIAITKLPPPRAIKTAILKMDATVVTREGIDKLLNMLPTEEERGKIQEAQMANPELPLGSAEQFLLTLASISELGARLKLWAFRLDFDNSEKEISEPLMDLKQGIEILRNNRTFKCILSTLLSIGIFLNGAPVKGFQIEYLAKVPEVKDTVHKHSLLHHLCHMVMETSKETTDLYSEIGPITRASKADFTDLAHNLTLLETECKASWDRLKLIATHDCPPQLKQKLVDFLADCAERIIILQIVHRRVINRYRKFLLWLGVPQHSVVESKPNEFCRILSEFSLEYRTTRERVQQQMEKKANHRERNKTRGKMIIDVGKFKTKEDRADAELKELLGTPSPGTVDGTLTWRRRRAEQLRSPTVRQSEENFTDGDDEILESLVKTATKAPGTRTTPRERKRTRHADRKSLKRSRTREGLPVERAPSQ